jgi:hypothetical protein
VIDAPTGGKAMVKKRGGKRMSTGTAAPEAPATPKTRPVRLDLAVEDHARLDAQAKRYGLTKSSYVRMAVYKWLEHDEREERGAK